MTPDEYMRYQIKREDQGGDVGDRYDEVQNMFKQHEKDRVAASRDVSQAFKEAGIPGHEYMPAEDMYKDTGSRNFVIYDPNRINILESFQFDEQKKLKENLKKYGLIGLLMGGGVNELLQGQEN
jgi:hypothetical protein